MFHPLSWAFAGSVDGFKYDRLQRSWTFNCILTVWQFSIDKYLPTAVHTTPIDKELKDRKVRHFLWIDKNFLFHNYRKVNELVTWLFLALSAQRLGLQQHYYWNWTIFNIKILVFTGLAHLRSKCPSIFKNEFGILVLNNS